MSAKVAGLYPIEYLTLAVRLDGADPWWSRVPREQLSIDPVADGRIGQQLEIV